MAKKIDEQAVAGVLQSISSLMAPVSRVVGPQLWQGGAAGRFAGTLAGHNRSLASMMDEVWTAEKATNNDTPPAPPGMPLVAPPPSSSVALLNPDLADQMARSLDAVSGALPGLGGKLSALLAPASPAPDTGVCKSVARWCGTQAGIMRNRAEYARASDKVGAHFVDGNSPNRGMGSVPDSDTWGTQEMGALGRLQAKLFNHSVAGTGPQARADIATIGSDLHRNSRDPSYAAYLAGFLGNVTPGSVGKLPYWLRKQNGSSGPPLKPSDTNIIGNYGDAVAAMSRFESQAHPGSKNRPITEGALGAYGADLPSQGLLVKFSHERWDSHVLAQLGAASLRWRLKYPSYEIGNSSLPAEKAQRYNDLHGPHVPNWYGRDWGFSPDQAADMDPALNILRKIGTQKDEAAARELATSLLPEDLRTGDPEKKPALSWLSRLPGDRYTSLLLAPDWLDHGDAAGNVLRLAVTQRAGMPSGDREQAARVTSDIMKEMAWWNGTDKSGGGRAKIDDLLRKAHVNVMPSGFDKSGQHSLEMGSGLRAQLFQVARENLGSIAQADINSGGTDIVNIDPMTGKDFFTISGKDAQAFLRSFAADNKQWAQLVVDSDYYNQKLFAWGIQHPEMMGDATSMAAFLKGSLINSYAMERTNRVDIDKKEWLEAKSRLEYLQGLVGEMLPKVPLPRLMPSVKEGKLSKSDKKTLGDVEGMSDVYSQGTGWLIAKLDDAKQKKFEDAMNKISGYDEYYADNLYLDMAMAKRAVINGPLGFYKDKSLDEVFAKRGSLSKSDKDLLVDWAMHTKVGSKDGFDLMTHDVEPPLDHQAPSSRD